MRCAIIAGLLVAVIALSEARSFKLGRLAALRARAMDEQAYTTVVPQPPLIHTMPDPTLEATMFAARCMLNLSTWTDPPTEVWESDNILEYHEEPWFPCIMTIGAVMYYSSGMVLNEVKDWLDHVFLQHADEIKCMLLNEKGHELNEAIEDDQVPLNVVNIIKELDQVITCHCETREKEMEKLVKLYDDILTAEGSETDPAQGDRTQTTPAQGGRRNQDAAKVHAELQRQLNRMFSSPAGTRALSRLLMGDNRKQAEKKGKEGEDSSKSCDDKDNKCDDEPLLKPTTLDAILFASDCVLNETLHAEKEELCNTSIDLLDAYTKGDLTTEDFIQQRVRLIRCAEWTVLSEHIQYTKANDMGLLGAILSDPTVSGLWAMVELEVSMVCDPSMEQGPPLRELKKMLANQINKK